MNKICKVSLYVFHIFLNYLTPIHLTLLDIRFPENFFTVISSLLQSQSYSP